MMLEFGRIILIFFSAIENCTWHKTQWESWSECELEKDQSCGNGFKFRERGECLCGEKNEKQNASLCGLPPTQIQSCYVLCSGK